MRSKQCDDAPAAIDTDALAVPDTRGRSARTHHRRQAELASNDGRVAHRAADIRYRASDLLEDRRPSGIRDLTDQDVARLQPDDLFHRLHHARRSLHNAV